MKAEEARKVANAAIEKAKKAEYEGLSKIHIEIGKAANLGKFSYDIFDLSPLVMEILGSEGYRIERHVYVVNKCRYTISW